MRLVHTHRTIFGDYSYSDQWELVAMPFRLFMERKIMKRVPFKLVLQEMPELVGKVSKTRYNHWTDKMVSSYKGDSDYEALEKEIEGLL